MRQRGLYMVCLILMVSGCTTIKISQPSKQAQVKTSLLYRFMQGYPLPRPAFDLVEPGDSAPIDYSLYGKFNRLGKSNYEYQITDREGLKKAVGAGIYPNQDAVMQHPFYKEMVLKNISDGAYWDYVKKDDYKTAFYLWAQAHEELGIKTFFTGVVLENAGHILNAIKAYHAAVIHFPKAVCWAEDRSFVWYIAEAAVHHIKRLCRDYPSLNIDYVGAQVTVENGKDTDLSNDVILVNPGRLIIKTLKQKIGELPDLETMSVVQTRGQGQVRLLQFANGHWQLRVNGRPFFVRGVSYQPTEIGLGPHNDPLFLERWMFSDKNNNGKIDAVDDAWVDKNRNGRQDDDEPCVGDFRIMKLAGINAIRFFVPTSPAGKYDPAWINKSLLRDVYERFGIRLILYDMMGAYTVGSGARWEDGTDYTDPIQRQRMKAIVRDKVMDLRDEPYVLMWVLGNENNLPAQYMGINASRTNAASHPRAYAEFLNEVAEMIHDLDPHHPVGVGNSEVGLLEDYAKYAPALDFIGINSYRGKEGFGELWQEAKNKFDRPVLIAEYGCDAYFQGRGEDEEGQYAYHVGNLRDIVFNQAGGPFVGNAIGGVIFEYLDEWWKDPFGNPEDIHQTEPQDLGPFPDGFKHEEWFGIVAQGSGRNSPFERRLRKAYYLYQQIN